MRPRCVAHVLAPDVSLDAAGLLSGFRAKGWNAHLISDRAGQAVLEHIAALPDDVVVRYVHPPPRGRRAGRSGQTVRLLERLLGSCVRHPLAVAAILGPRGAPGTGRNRDRYGDAVLAALRPRIAHFHSADAAEGRIAFSHRLGAKAVVSLSDAYLAAVDRVRSDLPWLEAADALVLPASPIARRAVGQGLPANRCVMLALPVAGGQATRLEVGDGLRILSIGELSWRQGYEHGIHAARLLLDRGIDCRYRLVGDGSHKGALRFARRQLGIEDRVELIGRLEAPDIGRQLAWADVLLDPAVADVPDGLVELAIELGVPVVAARGTPPAAPEGVEHVRRRDPGALAARLAEIAAAPDLLERRVARAASVEEPLSLEALVERLESLYLGLLEEREPSGP
jgi:glycosyltransferase involved in cell wall biosynthesis